jgi:hypothetical protein
MDPALQAAARAELEADLVALRRHHVKSFAQTPSGFTVEFFAAAPAPMPDVDRKAAAANDPDICKCGHAQFAHMNGFCVEGCDAAKCGQEEKADAKRP